MSSFLALCQDVHRECGASGTAPTGVTSQTGEANRIVSWVKQSWIEIQNSKNNWRWMRSRFTVNTVADDDTYAYADCTDTIDSAVISRFARWYPSEFKCYLTSAGVGSEIWLTEKQWDDFRPLWKIGTQTSSHPADVAIDPQENFVLGPKPSAVYTVTGDYQKGPQSLTADADIPEMPTRFHALIQYEAMRKYAVFNAAPEVWAEVQDQAAMMVRDLEASQLPPLNFGDPLC